MEKVILIGGQAGQGINFTSHLIGQAFTNLGYSVFEYRDYPSLIRGGHNFNILRISDKPVFSHKERYDVILALDQKTIDFHQKELKSGGFIIGNKNLRAEKIYQIDTESILKKIGTLAINEGNILVGYFFKYFGLEKDLIFKIVGKKLSAEEAELAKEAISEGYLLAEEKEKIKKISKEKYFLTGNEAIAIGALSSGLDVYLAYPMTPTTQVLNFLAKRSFKDNILVFQPESEISVINAALGASFAGAKVMIGTSGGGFALMNEAISLAGMAEVPLVVYLGQRSGPATGLPTYTSQADLKFAISSGHGEFPKVIVAPADPKEAIQRVQEAFYLSLKYRLPVIVLGDKHLAESAFTFEEIDSPSISQEKFIFSQPPQNYLSYGDFEKYSFFRAVPGQEVIVKVNSYEHNEEGNTTEDQKEAKKMVHRRLKKGALLAKEIENFGPIALYGQGKNLILGWGSTKGAILDALNELEDFRFLQISYLSPFPAAGVLEELKKSKEVILVENNATGQLADLISEKTGFQIKKKILKADGRPFRSEIIIQEIKKYGN